MSNNLNHAQITLESYRRLRHAYLTIGLSPQSFRRYCRLCALYGVEVGK